MLQSIGIQILPTQENEDEVIRVVDEVIDYIKSTGLNYYVGPFETAIEGEDLNELFEIAKNCTLIAGKENKAGVMAYIKVSYKHEGDVLSIAKKVTKHH